MLSPQEISIHDFLCIRTNKSRVKRSPTFHRSENGRPSRAGWAGRAQLAARTSGCFGDGLESGRSPRYRKVWRAASPSAEGQRNTVP